MLWLYLDIFRSTQAWSVKKRRTRLSLEEWGQKTVSWDKELISWRLSPATSLIGKHYLVLEIKKYLTLCRLIQGQVTRAEVEETTFAMKRELAAIKQHDIDTHMKLEEATERIKTLSEQLEDQSSKTPSLEEVSLKSEIIKQKQEMIECLQEELIKVSKSCLFLHAEFVSNSCQYRQDYCKPFSLSVSTKLCWCIYSCRPTSTLNMRDSNLRNV